VPIRYVDRATQDQRLLVYETPAMTEDVELTGHPVVSLQVRSTATDGAFFVYLEDSFPDGTVVYLTEGELRAVHRKVSSEKPPVAVFGPYHTFKRADAMPLVAGEVAEITFDLLPISTIIRAGHRIRVAIAGHDSDTFTRYPADETPVLQFQRNAQYASWIDLPLQSRGDLGALPTKLPVIRPLGGLCPALGFGGALTLLLCVRTRWRVNNPLRA
jgi:putative CocE/NonD family hydrolase